MQIGDPHTQANGKKRRVVVMLKIEKMLMEVQVKTKTKEDSLYNILTKEEHKSYREWMQMVGFKIKGTKVVDLINKIAFKEDEGLKEKYERFKNLSNGVAVGDLCSIFNGPDSLSELEKELNKR